MNMRQKVALDWAVPELLVKPMIEEEGSGGGGSKNKHNRSLSLAIGNKPQVSQKAI